MSYFFLLALGIGIVAGLRSLTAPAVVAWGAHIGWLNLQGSRLAFMGSIIAVAIFSMLALGELIADKQPWIPKRTSPVSLLTRFLTGGFCGASFSLAASQSLVIGTLMGGIWAMVGAYLGYDVRTRLVSNLHIKDFVVAACEDFVAIGLAVFIVSR